jgi:hypothetical protein
MGVYELTNRRAMLLDVVVDQVCQCRDVSINMNSSYIPGSYGLVRGDTFGLWGHMSC